MHAFHPLTWPLVWQYAFATGLAVATLLLRFVLDPVLGDGGVFLLVGTVLLPLILLVRPGPFLAAATIAILGAWFAFLPPRLSLRIYDPLEAALLGLALTAVAAAMFAAWLAARLQETRRHVDDRLREQEGLMQGTFDNAAVGMAQVSSDGRWVNVNDRLCEITGYTREELLQTTFAEITHPEDFRADWEQAHRLIAGQIDSYAVEKRYLRKDGSAVPVMLTVSLVRNADGSPRYFFSVIDDLSARHRATEALRESEERFRNMADDAPVVVWVTDPDGASSYLSRSWYEFTGQAPGFALGFGWRDAVHPDDREASSATFLAANERREAFQLEYRVRRADGEFAWVIDSARPRSCADGKFLGYIGSVIDITERKQMEQALRDADRRKDEFIAILAHELRNPLAAIRMAMGVIRRADGDMTRAVGMAEIIERQSAQLSRLVDELMDTSRVSRGIVEMQKAPVDLAAIMAHAAEGIRSECHAKNLEFSVSLPEQPLMIEADAVRISQVLNNLVCNACKYTDHGKVTLEAERLGDEALVRVVDTGLGIPQDQLPHIFDMFAQVGGQGRSRGGLGIGLALARSIVHLHDGRIEVRSEPGKGSEFIIRLPLADKVMPVAASEHGEAAHEPGSRQLRRRRILVVDDNLDVLEAVATMLRMSGHEVITADNGVAGFEAAVHHPPEIALLDIGMPGMDGYELARRIRAEAWGRGICLVVMTGWGQEKDKQRATAAGFDAHLTKPVEPETLEAVLQQAAD
jgi:PAS domain S-box-containing protein